MWVRQEYKPDKLRFERSFTIEANLKSSGDISEDKQCDKINIELEQSYRALGTTVWDGSIALAKIFECGTVYKKTDLEMSRVLELGAGCGLVGIYLSFLGAKHVTLTDMHLCIPTLKENVTKNVPAHRSNSIKVMEYCWGKSCHELLANGPFDLVVAAEVLYDEEDSKKLAETIVKVIHKHSKVFLSMGRNRLGEENFVRTITSYGHQVIEVPKEKHHPKYQDQIIKILQVIPT